MSLIKHVGLEMNVNQLKEFSPGDILLAILKEWNAQVKVVTVRRFCDVCNELGIREVEQYMEMEHGVEKVEQGVKVTEQGVKVMEQDVKVMEQGVKLKEQGVKLMEQDMKEEVEQYVKVGQGMERWGKM
eukprot:Em0015g656a